MLCIVPALALLAYLTFYLGCVQGQEFSPDTFQRRSFAYYELPLFGLQVSPISRDFNTGTCEKYLIDQKLVVPDPKASAEPRWDLVYANRGFGATERLSAYSEAKILCYYLDALDKDGKSIWRTWSEKNPSQAGILWPAIASLARQHLYLFTPDLMRLAGANPTPEQLKSQIAQTLSAKYCLLARSHKSLGRYDTAVELFTEALVHSPGLSEARLGRAEALEALGKHTEAEADRQAAQQPKSPS
jgi:tetratricopeptide (TPR) repeat protein